MAGRVVVEWVRGALRIAVSEGRGAVWKLKSFVVEPAPDGGPAGPHLKAVLQRLKATQAEAVSVIPREQTLTRIVKFPSTDAQELAQMVQLYARAQLPYPPEQAVVDHHVLLQAEGVSHVGIVACQREVVERHLDVVRQAGLSPGHVTVSAWGVLGWYRRLAATPPAEPVLVINVDEHRTDLVMIQAKRLVACRSIGQGMRDWKAAGELVELLAAEADRSRASVRKELPGVEVRSIVLTGAGPLAQWSEPLAQRIGLPVTVIESASGFDTPPGALPSTVSPLAAAGVAVSERESLLNLNPQELRADFRFREQFKDLSTVGMLALTVLVCAAGVLAALMLRHQRQASAIEQALSTIEPAADRVRRQTKSVQLVESVLSQRKRLAGQLAGLFERTPEAVVLETLAFERARRELIVRGHAPSTQAVLEFIQLLEQLEGIEGVSLKYSRRRSSSSGDQTEFELVCRQAASS